MDWGRLPGRQGRVRHLGVEVLRATCSRSAADEHTGRLRGTTVHVNIAFRAFNLTPYMYWDSYTVPKPPWGVTQPYLYAKSSTVVTGDTACGIRVYTRPGAASTS